jgi:flagellar hook-basal body complex protein FliE
MADLFTGNISGHVVDLQRTHPNHMASKLHPQTGTAAEGKNFGRVLTDTLEDVNGLAQESTQLTQQYIIDPDSVDAHDVTIAMSKANLAVALTKSVVDGALNAYKEIINLR